MTRRSRHRCFYCGEIGRPSKEHILSGWLQDLLPKTGPGSDHTLTHARTDPATGKVTEVVSKGRFTRDGDPLSLTARTACEACNNGWMSNIVNRAKAPLSRLALLNWSPLTDDERLAVAAWATLVSMNYEYGDSITAAIPQTDRDHIRQTGKPPAHWRIWIAKYRDIGPRKLHRGLGVFPNDEVIEDKCNIQTTIFNVGLLLIQTASCHSVWFDLSRFKLHVGQGPFVPFWPEGSTYIPDVALGPQHFNDVADAFTAAFTPQKGGVLS